MTTKDEKIETVVSAMSRMTERQKDYFLRYVITMRDDPNFYDRVKSEEPIFTALMAAEDYKGLDRWFMRGRLTLINRNLGIIQ